MFESLAQALATAVELVASLLSNPMVFFILSVYGLVGYALLVSWPDLDP